jgi:hypothetical protein
MRPLRRPGYVVPGQRTGCRYRWAGLFDGAGGATVVIAEEDGAGGATVVIAEEDGAGGATVVMPEWAGTVGFTADASAGTAPAATAADARPTVTRILTRKRGSPRRRRRPLPMAAEALRLLHTGFPVRGCTARP